MQGKVYLRHKLGIGAGVYGIDGDVKWYSNSVVRVVTETQTYEIPIENIAAIVFSHSQPEVSKSASGRCSYSNRR